MINKMNMEEMNFTSVDDLVDEVFGKRGTPDREAMEEQLKEEVRAYFADETIKQ